MPNPRLMEGYTPGVDDDPSSYVEEARIRELGCRLAPIADTEDSSSSPEDRSDEPAYFPEPSFTTDDEETPPSSLPREIVTVEPSVTREVVTTSSSSPRGAPSSETSVGFELRRRRRHHRHRRIVEPGPKNWYLWMILGSVFTLLLVLVAIAGMVMAWAFFREEGN